MRCKLGLFALCGFVLAACGGGIEEDADETQSPLNSSIIDAPMNGPCNATSQVAAETVRAIVSDLGRWRPGVDFAKKSDRLALTPTGEARCASRGGCSELRSLLAYQSIDWQQRLQLAGDFPWLKNLLDGELRNKLCAGMPDYNNPWSHPAFWTVPHEAQFANSRAVPNAQCAGLTYHCYRVTGATAEQVKTAVANVVGSTSELRDMVQPKVEDGFLCVDPVGGIGDLSSPATGSSAAPSCVDGSMPILNQGNNIGACCKLPNTTTGRLYVHPVVSSYLVCR